MSSSPPVWQEAAPHFRGVCGGRSLHGPLMNSQLVSCGYIFFHDTEHLSTYGTFNYIYPVVALINTPHISTLLRRTSRKRSAQLQ